MRARAIVATVGAAAAICAVLAGCGVQHPPVASTPAVTVPTPTGPALTAAALEAKTSAACTRLYAALDGLGQPPTDDIAKARQWYPAAAKAWHQFLATIAPLVPPADMVRDWADLVENSRVIAEDADKNVALAESGREAIEVINSDPTAQQGERNISNSELLSRMGFDTCLQGG